MKLPIEETEQAFANGYSAGYEAGRRSAGVQKHGRWIGRTNIGRFDFRYECSACRGRADLETNYCPHCGAKMDGGADNA